ncbi:hypothetical protein LTR29_006514 [Friedmanniomyces endolithicus]|nr:hypothetical protein LTR29_006514 [Friedmanniomyces endolithicus]
MTLDGEAETLGWHLIEKNLYLLASDRQGWLHLKQKQAAELTSGELVIKSIRVALKACGQQKGRLGNIRLLRVEYRDDLATVVTGNDVLFGTDAVDPPAGMIPCTITSHARCTAGGPDCEDYRTAWQAKGGLCGPWYAAAPLRADHNGKFKIVQISDTHIVTGPGVCKDASDAKDGHYRKAERPDLVILTGDQLHHDIPDSQSTLLKDVALIIETARSRSQWCLAIVTMRVPMYYPGGLSPTLSTADDLDIGNAQMQILETLPFNLAQAGPADKDGISNYHVQVFGTAPSPTAMATLVFIDSHGQVPSEVRNPDYKPIQRTQMKRFTETAQTLRKAREKHHNPKHVSLAFQHIPLPEFADSNLATVGGHRREPTEGPSVNTHFYDALVEVGVIALGCGHDHVNDFCGLLPRKQENALNGEKAAQSGPWLCYGGGSGFGGYMSYGPNRYHRRTRVWEFDAETGGVTTWKRVEYASERVDELVLVVGGEVVPP